MLAMHSAAEMALIRRRPAVRPPEWLDGIVSGALGAAFVGGFWRWMVKRQETAPSLQAQRYDQDAAQDAFSKTLRDELRADLQRLEERASLQDRKIVVLEALIDELREKYRNAVDQREVDRATLTAMTARNVELTADYAALTVVNMALELRLTVALADLAAEKGRNDAAR